MCTVWRFAGCVATMELYSMSGVSSDRNFARGLAALFESPLTAALTKIRISVMSMACGFPAETSFPSSLCSSTLYFVSSPPSEVLLRTMAFSASEATALRVAFFICWDLACIVFIQSLGSKPKEDSAFALAIISDCLSFSAKSLLFSSRSLIVTIGLMPVSLRACSTQCEGNPIPVSRDFSFFRTAAEAMSYASAPSAALPYSLSSGRNFTAPRSICTRRA
mmetsp:Transcript_42447/g.70783  ORF Transcript_42447/g.70783 Transcript_42447/m.70783 type:complete len:221 (+) Transcript_42447:4987-5649(+)